MRQIQPRQAPQQ